MGGRTTVPAPVARSLAVLLALAASAGCGPRGAAHPPLPATATLTAAAIDGGWRTMRAEHRVTVSYGEAGAETRRMRGALAVERPDRFRLRALGPAGITVFDVLGVAGEVTVLAALGGGGAGAGDGQEGALAALSTALAGDLAAAYDLAPRPPGRRVTASRGTILVEEPERTVRLARFRAAPGGRTYPGHIGIDHRGGARRYRVEIDVGDTVLDEPLDPALFAPR